MLDLLSNILNVTYTTGTFWGGGFHGFAAHQSNVFANLNVFKARGGFTNFVDALSEDLSNLGNKAQTAVQKNGGVLNTIKSLLNNIGGMLMSGMLNKLGRPQKTMFNSLLSPAPIGFWHVTIGNPKHPIMSIGNMVITNVTVEHNGPLGLDDFPTELTVTVSLKHGMPRDSVDIQKMYTQGRNSIHTKISNYKNFKFFGYKNVNESIEKRHKNKLKKQEAVKNEKVKPIVVQKLENDHRLEIPEIEEINIDGTLNLNIRNASEHAGWIGDNEIMRIISNKDSLK
jgi:hypothetical protein